MLRADWSCIHETGGFHLYTLPLALMSCLYGIGVRIRNAFLKDRGKGLPGFVLSVGNITAGGTGKTPAVIMLARWAESSGYNVAILSRGYGGKNNSDAAVVSDGKTVLLSPEISGDEPWLMASSLDNVPVIVSRKRYLAGMEAKNRFGCNFFILDDGFQHIHLKRDMDIVLADATSPFGNGHLLPWGPLREPLSGLKRADALVFTRAGDTPPNSNRNPVSGLPVFSSDHVPAGIIFPLKKEEHDLSFINGKRVIAFSGIGRPASFKKTLLDLGAKLISFKAFGDHYPFSERDLTELEEEMRKLGADMLITTEKDWARIRHMASGIAPIALLRIDFVIKAGQKEFFNIIKKKADSVLRKFNNGFES